LTIAAADRFRSKDGSTGGDRWLIPLGMGRPEATDQAVPGRESRGIGKEYRPVLLMA
jgi:hypothetical protein